MPSPRRTLAIFKILPTVFEYFNIVNVEFMDSVVSVDIEIGSDEKKKHRLHLNAIYDPKTRMISLYTRVSFTLLDDSVVNALNTINDVQGLLFNEDHMCSITSTGQPDENNYTHFFVYTNQFLPARFIDKEPSEKTILACKHIINQFVDSYSAIFNFLLKNLAIKTLDVQREKHRLN